MAEVNSHSITFSKVYERQPLPDNANDIDLLIVMGGPQSPDTTLEECSHFDGKSEIVLIKKCIDSVKQ